MKVEIFRFFSDTNQTSGVCVVTDKGFPLFTALSLERGNRDNKIGVSCVPSGKYILKYEYSNRFKRKLWELKDVPNRSECKFHAANFWHQLNGCISLGQTYNDLNKDSYKDITNSKNTMESFEKVLQGLDEVTLIIY